MYVLDTNVISELRKVKAGKADSKVIIQSPLPHSWGRGLP